MDVIAPRGPLAARRMTAHWVVLAAAALTTLVAAAVGAALAVFAGQALPQAVRHDLSVAAGTSLTAQASVDSSQMSSVTSALRQAIGTAIQACRSASGRRPGPTRLAWCQVRCRPLRQSSARGTRPSLEAAAMQGVTDHAVLVSGRWPAGGAGPVQAALPATAAALLHVSVGDVLQLQGPGLERVRHVQGHRPVRAAPAVRDQRGLVLEPGLAARLRVEHRSADSPPTGRWSSTRARSPRRSPWAAAPGSRSPTWRLRRHRPAAISADLSALRSYRGQHP